MASLVARRLTEAHRLAQARLGADTVRLQAATFPLIDPNAVEATFDRFLQVSVPVIQAQRARSSALASAYLATFRMVETGGTFAPVVAGDAPVEQVTTSMLVTGPIALRARLAAGLSEADAVDKTMAGNAAAAMRLALDAGRQTIVDTVRADPRADRWARVTSGSACDFCTMLEGRGFVYVEDTADFESHDHCACSAEPFYQ